MIANITFITFSIVWVFFLKKFNNVRSERMIFVFKYLLMAISGAQFFSVFIYGGKTKGGYPAEEILFFQDLLVTQLQLPGYIQFFALAIFLFICFFCHPKHKDRV
ncbi:hypothetical protein [Vibrio sp. TBV020]|uniref:hypothetical protein n=1 Tax=Vibrio sp. TBV020 TaxID=3137398 RepID=UPI0038CD133B